MSYYNKNDLNVEEKSDSTPVTEADLAADKLIRSALEKLPFTATIISEEDTEKNKIDINNAQYTWLVDPLDGTRGFINKTDEFAVSIGLLKNLKPIAGVIYLPVKKTTYFGIVGGGCFKCQNHGKPSKIDSLLGEKSSIIINQSYQLPKNQSEKFKVRRLAAAGKFGILSEGQCGMYFRNGPTYEWDTAAGHAIILASGAKMLQLDGQEFLYGKENFLNQPFVVFNQNNEDWKEQLSEFSLFARQ
jgi:3'(2'), 5'-bisphosphate nucleotidase